MNPVATEDSVLDVPPRSLWRALRDLAVSIVVVAAIALIVSFLSATSAPAQGKAGAARELRIGYQKSASLFVLQKAQGSLEKRLAPMGVGVKWVEFPAGPQLLEGLNVGAVDVGYVGEAPPIFAQAAGAKFVYFGYDPAAPRAEADDCRAAAHGVARGRIVGRPRPLRRRRLARVARPLLRARGGGGLGALDALLDELLVPA